MTLKQTGVHRFLLGDVIIHTFRCPTALKQGVHSLEEDKVTDLTDLIIKASLTMGVRALFWLP